jgi:hypothetical protein
MAAVAVLRPGSKAAAEAAQQMDVDASTSSSAAGGDEDLYTRLKTLQRQLEFLEIQVRCVGGWCRGATQPAMCACVCHAQVVGARRSEAVACVALPTHAHSCSNGVVYDHVAVAAQLCRGHGGSCRLRLRHHAHVDGCTGGVVCVAHVVRTANAEAHRACTRHHMPRILLPRPPHHAPHCTRRRSTSRRSRRTSSASCCRRRRRSSASSLCRSSSGSSSRWSTRPAASWARLRAATTTCASSARSTASCSSPAALWRCTGTPTRSWTSCRPRQTPPSACWATTRSPM